jgi:hypothetical protein
MKVMALLLALASFAVMTVVRTRPTFAEVSFDLLKRSLYSTECDPHGGGLSKDHSVFLELPIRYFAGPAQLYLGGIQLFCSSWVHDSWVGRDGSSRPNRRGIPRL